MGRSRKFVPCWGKCYSKIILWSIFSMKYYFTIFLSCSSVRMWVGVWGAEAYLWFEGEGFFSGKKCLGCRTREGKGRKDCVSTQAGSSLTLPASWHQWQKLLQLAVIKANQSEEPQCTVAAWRQQPTFLKFFLVVAATIL